MPAMRIDLPETMRETIRKVEGLQRERIPRAARKAMNGGGQEFVKGIRRAIPRAKTRGHNTNSIKRSAGKKVRRQRDGFYNLKVGIGVGKKRGTVPKHAATNVAGTIDRYTGAKQIRKRGKAVGIEQTGNSRKFRGRNTAMDVVRIGVEASASAAESKMVEIAQRELAREASSWEQRNGIS